MFLNWFHRKFESQTLKKDGTITHHDLFHAILQSTLKKYFIPGFQSVSQDVADNVRWLDPTIGITYSFALYHPHGCHDVICRPSI